MALSALNGLEAGGLTQLLVTYLGFSMGASLALCSLGFELSFLFESCHTCTRSCRLTTSPHPKQPTHRVERHSAMAAPRQGDSSVCCWLEPTCAQQRASADASPRLWVLQSEPLLQAAAINQRSINCDASYPVLFCEPSPVQIRSDQAPLQMVTQGVAAVHLYEAEEAVRLSGCWDYSAAGR